ncbi:homeobox protein TGIF2LX-like [Molossus molossus]|uniref:homeobox protein TGIF2LX-like n=1 Tax=Molossus molossus TaxID=27622 RepID=UPI001747196E|nr:homeobox protein TGIF2LX-like [Molossus molossus]
MEEGEENQGSTSQGSPQDTSRVSSGNTSADEVQAPAGGEKRKGMWPTESEKIFRKGPSEHRFQLHPWEVEAQMRSERISVSKMLIAKRAMNVRRHIPPEMFQDDGEAFASISPHHQKGRNATVIHQGEIDQSTQAQVGPTDPEEVRCLPPSPLPTAQESEGKRLDPEAARDQKIEARSEEKVQISTCSPWCVSSPEPTGTEEYSDFSGLQLLVDVAVQKAAELELQKKQEPNP